MRWLATVVVALSVLRAGERIAVPTATGRVHAVGTASVLNPDGTRQKLIGILFEPIRPEAIKGRDIMLYFSDTDAFHWLFEAEGKLISFECPSHPELEEGKGKPRLYLFDRATVKEEVEK